MLPLRVNLILSPPPPSNAKHARSKNPGLAVSRFAGRTVALSPKTLLQLENAAKLIETLPAAGESLHVICNGNFASWDIVPAILKLTGDTIRRLDVATLGFSKTNVADMAACLDSGTIGELWLVYSCYFDSTSGGIAQVGKEAFDARPERVRYAAFRNHAKILLIETARGEFYTVETSANLRSCKNIEQYAISNDRGLLEFHRRWIESAIREVAANGKAK